MMVKLTLRGLAAHRMRTALTAVAVLLGVAFVTGTLIFSATLDRTIDDAFAQAGEGTDAVVRTRTTIDTELGEAPSDRPVPASLLAAVASAPGVAKAHGTVEGFAAVVDRKGKIVGPEPQLGADWYADPDLSLMRLATGRPPAAAGEIAVDENTAADSGYRIGDRVPVALQSGSRTFTLTGTFRYGEGSLAGAAAVTAFTPETAQRLLMSRPGTYRQITLHAADGVSQERLRDAVAAVLPAGYEAVTGEQVITEVKEPVDDILKALRTVLLAFALIAMFVGSFIIFNTFTMLVAQRTRELALLRAVGASRRQVTWAVLGEAAGVGLIGSTLGLVAGGVIAVLLSMLLTYVLGGEVPISGLAVPGSAVVAAYAVGMTVTLVAAYIPARRAARTPPVAALRDEHAAPVRSARYRTAVGALLAVAGAAGLVTGGSLTVAGAAAAAVFLGVILLGPTLSGPLLAALGRPLARTFTGRLSSSNARRNPRRTAATAAALMVGMALIGTVSVITQSLVASVDRQLETGLTADYRVTPRSQITAIGLQPYEAVAKAPGVRSAIAIRTAPIRLDGAGRQAVAGDPAQLAAHYRLRLEEGGTGDGVLLSRSEAGGRHAGGSIPVEYQDGTKTSVRIAGIYADVETAMPTAPSVIIDLRTYRAHYPDTRLDHIDIVAEPGAEPGRALADALAPWPNLQVQDREAIKDEYGQNVALLVQMVLALLVLSIVIAALGIVNTLALSVVERTREIGLLRAVGMQRRQVRRMVRYEAVLISVFGAVLGLGTGVVFGMAMRRAMAGVDVLAVPYGRLGLYLAAAGLIGVVAAAWPARQAARMDVLRAIQEA